MPRKLFWIGSNDDELAHDDETHENNERVNVDQSTYKYNSILIKTMLSYTEL